MDGGETPSGQPPRPVTEGEWAGWSAYDNDPFEAAAGPFYVREEAGQVTCAFRAEPRHMNSSGFMHGGCLMTFADFALFCIGREAIGGADAVTASLNSEFVEAAQVGDVVQATGEVVRAGGSLVFLRGQLACGARTLMTFSAILKKTRRR
jgi:uncharacterized protein (TIGR00369 family)